MPFLRAKLKSAPKKPESDIPVIVSVPSCSSLLPSPVTQVVLPDDGDRTLRLFTEAQVMPASVAHGIENKKKGKEYELYIGSIYEKYGYGVEYNGIEKNAWDDGVDLICHLGRYTVLVQCKCYTTNMITANMIYQFFGSSRHYAVKHPREVVSSSLWTSLKLK